MMQHKEEKRFMCNVCGRKYTQKHNLTKHQLTKHSSPKLYCCGKCTKTYLHPRSLEQHEKKHIVPESKPCKVELSKVDANELCEGNWLNFVEKNGICKRRKKEDIDRRLRNIVEGKFENDWFFVNKIVGKGRGVCAKVQLPHEEPVLLYGGRLVPEESGRLHNEYGAMEKDPGSYLFDFKVSGKHYCFDATYDDGRIGRLVNHAKKGFNVVVKKVFVDDKPNLILHTCAVINVGDEIVYDYNEKDPEVLKHFTFLKH